MICGTPSSQDAFTHQITNSYLKGAQWLSGRVLDSRPRGRGFEPHRRHCVVSLSKNINPSLVLVQPRKTRPFITERLLMGRKELNQTNKQNLKEYRRYEPDLMQFLETRSEVKFNATVSQLCNATLRHPKMHPHTKFEIPTSNK